MGERAEDIQRPGEAHWDDADAACRTIYESSASDWSKDSVYVWLEPTTMFAFASDPGRVASTAS